MAFRFFDKKTESWVTVAKKARANVNEVLTKKWHKPVTEKFKRKKEYLIIDLILWYSVIIFDNIWAADLAADLGSLSSKNC